MKLSAVCGTHMVLNMFTKATTGACPMPIHTLIPNKILWWNLDHDKWVPVTTARRVLKLRLEEQPPIWRVAGIYWISSHGQLTRGGPPAWSLGNVLTTPNHKNWPCCEWIHVLQAWIDPLVWPKQWRRNMTFGTWNVRSLYRSGSLTAAARELATY
jgi:hypothetical protein